MRFFLEDELDDEASLPQYLLQNLMSALAYLAADAPLAKPQDVQRRIKGYSCLLMTKVILEASSWERQVIASLASQTERNLWAHYCESLRQVDNYVSPADHIRAGVEGYCLLVDELVLEASLFWSQRHPIEQFDATIYERLAGAPVLECIPSKLHLGARALPVNDGAAEPFLSWEQLGTPGRNCRT